MSDETLDLIARRSDLLTKKDKASKVQRKARDEAADAYKELRQVEDDLHDLEKEEIKALQ